MSADTIPLSNIKFPQHAKIHNDMQTKEKKYFFISNTCLGRKSLVGKNKFHKILFSFKK